VWCVWFVCVGVCVCVCVAGTRTRLRQLYSNAWFCVSWHWKTFQWISAREDVG